MNGRLHPTDAQTYWMSATIPNDQFLVYCFDSDVPAVSVRDRLLHNARGIDELQVLIADAPLGLTYPRTRRMQIHDGLITAHDGLTWNTCLDSIAALFDHQLDRHDTTWRLHLFDHVANSPRCDGPALVAVLQISHALGDGRVASSLARRLFGDNSEPAFRWESRRRAGLREFLRRSTRAQQSERRLAADTEAGLVPPQAPGRPRTRVNVAPIGPSSVRCIVRDRSDLTAPGISVTVGAATAISLALGRYLAVHGDDVPAELGAEVTLGKSGPRRSRNHFRNAGVDLFPATADLVERARSIAGSLADRRVRADHPAMEAQSAVTEMVPAVLVQWGIRQFDAAAVPDLVTGNTVVSSVARGAANLSLGGGVVRFTAGFPALSPVMGLTHGVHGIGDTVTLSVTSSESAVPDPDVYAALVNAAADDVADAFGRAALI